MAANIPKRSREDYSERQEANFGHYKVEKYKNIDRKTGFFY